MKTVKKVCLLILTAALIFSTASCTDVQKENPSVWLIVKSTETQFWKAAFVGANAAKSEYNVDLTIHGPETEEDYETQNRYIRQAIAAGADAIVLSAISYTGNAEAVDEAVEAGRIACRTALNTEEPVLNVGIINFDAGVRNGQERESGFREELYQDDRVRQIYTINVLTTVEEAERQTRVLLTAHPEINVLVSFNEPLAVGAARAVDNLHLEDQVRLVCFDTNLECIDKMQRGIVSALIVQNPYAMGYLGVETACKIINGRYQENGEFLTTPAVVVTKDNMFTLEGQKVLFPFG